VLSVSLTQKVSLFRGLIFEDSMLRQVMDRFDDDGSGEIVK